MSMTTKQSAAEVVQELKTITFVVPLPPVSLRANSRAHWSRKKRDADAYSKVVYDRWLWTRSDRPWVPDRLAAASVHYEWRHASAKPDHSNLGGNTKHLQDIICVAPKLGFKQAAKYERTHLGLIENDSEISASYSLIKVAHKKDECVKVRITSR